MSATPKGPHQTPTEWFERGADALSRVLRGAPRGYMCPLCLTLFGPGAISLLHVDHVPARSVGGAELVLTCVACNSGSGSRLQAHMRRRENVTDVVRGRRPEAYPVEVRLMPADVAVRANLVVEAGHTITPVPEVNNPSALRRFYEEAQRLHQTGETFDYRVHFYRDHYDSAAARAGWLREAYLAAFAVFGYRYVLDPALTVVRNQIRNPDSELIGPFKVVQPQFDPAFRRLFVIRSPEEWQSILVQMGEHVMFLPLIDAPGIYERLRDQRRQDPGARISLPDEVAGEALDQWPRQPLYVMDFQLSEPVGEWRQAPIPGVITDAEDILACAETEMDLPSRAEER